MNQHVFCSALLFCSKWLNVQKQISLSLMLETLFPQKKGSVSNAVSALDSQWCVALGTQRPVCITSNSSLVQKVLVAAYLAGGRRLILRR